MKSFVHTWNKSHPKIYRNMNFLVYNGNVRMLVYKGSRKLRLYTVRHWNKNLKLLVHASKCQNMQHNVSRIHIEMHEGVWIQVKLNNLLINIEKKRKISCMHMENKVSSSYRCRSSLINQPNLLVLISICTEKITEYVWLCAWGNLEKFPKFKYNEY